MKSLFKLFIGILFITVMLKADEGTKYGKEIELKETTKISEIINNPAEYLGKTVLVEGTIINVCAKRGCWMELSSDKEFESIRVKVNDGEIIFPMEAKGQKALVEGEVYSINVETEHKCDHKEGESCETGEQKKEVKTIYQIKGLGAVIK